MTIAIGRGWAAAGIGALAMLAGGLTASGATPRDTVGWLMGRWAGQGSVLPADGPAEAFRCVVTYRAGEAGAHVQQNLRCQGAASKFDAATRLTFDGERVTGTWQENTHSLSGDVTGVVTPAGFEVSLSGRFFNAQMRVAGSDCAQEVRLVPVTADYIRELTASLRKC